MRTLNWTWTKYDHSIKIFDNGKQIGHIPKFYDNSISTINGKKFYIDPPPKLFYMFSSPPKFIRNPQDKNKDYCEIEYLDYPRFKLSSPSFEFFVGKISFWPFKRRWFITNKGIRMTELEIPGGFFKNKGIIKIFQEDNWELNIYSLFYFNTIPEPGE